MKHSHPKAIPPLTALSCPSKAETSTNIHTFQCIYKSQHFLKSLQVQLMHRIFDGEAVHSVATLQRRNMAKLFQNRDYAALWPIQCRDTCTRKEGMYCTKLARLLPSLFSQITPCCSRDEIKAESASETALELYSSQKCLFLKVRYKLKGKAVHLTTMERQNVKLFLHVMNSFVSNALKTHGVALDLVHA